MQRNSGDQYAFADADSWDLAALSSLVDGLTAKPQDAPRLRPKPIRRASWSFFLLLHVLV